MPGDKLSDCVVAVVCDKVQPDADCADGVCHCLNTI